jgi:DNA repair photolyase
MNEGTTGALPVDVVSDLKLKAVYSPKGKAGEFARLALNHYIGCPIGCLYCYAPTAARIDRARFHRYTSIPAEILRRFAGDCMKLDTWQQLEGIKAPPIMLCFLSDPYQPKEAKLGLTRSIIAIAHAFNLNISILTKQAGLAQRDFDLYVPGDEFGVSLTHWYTNTGKKWEPNADDVYARWNALIDAHRIGIRTIVSLEPCIVPLESLSVISGTHEHVDMFKLGMMNYHPHGKTIDWGLYGAAAVEILDSLGANYMVKADLRAEMDKAEAQDGR